MVIGIVENSQVLPILSHVRVQFAEQTLTLSTTDSELQLQTRVVVPGSDDQNIDVAVPARKFFDICRSLPAAAELKLTFDAQSLQIKTIGNQFKLSCLPSEQFPSAPHLEVDVAMTLAQDQFREVLARTCFSMATKDIRYYLNGVLFESHPNKLQTVATNGHRLAVQNTQAEVVASINCIMPRKAVLELMKLLDGQGDNSVKIFASEKNDARANRFF